MEDGSDFDRSTRADRELRATNLLALRSLAMLKVEHSTISVSARRSGY